jgi:hypothetical protein
MKKGSIVWGAAVLASLGLAVSAVAAEPAGEPVSGLVRMKSGVCKFTLLEGSNMKPVGGREISLTSSSDGAALAKTATDKRGVCSLDVSVGRFILGVDGRNVAIVEGQEASAVTECRILVPQGGLPVGGADAPAWRRPVIIGSVVVLTVLGGFAVGSALGDEGSSSEEPGDDTVTPPSGPQTSRGGRRDEDQGGGDDDDDDPVTW